MKTMLKISTFVVGITLIAAVVFSPRPAMADRTDLWLASSVRVMKVELSKLPDGGCAAQAYGSVSKTDGGTSSEGTGLVEVSGANRTTCLDMIDTKGLAIFKADRGL